MHSLDTCKLRRFTLHAEACILTYVYTFTTSSCLRMQYNAIFIITLLDISSVWTIMRLKSEEDPQQSGANAFLSQPRKKLGAENVHTSFMSQGICGLKSETCPIGRSKVYKNRPAIESPQLLTLPWQTENQKNKTTWCKE